MKIRDRILIGVVAVFMMVAGIAHFANQEVFMRMLPAWLPVKPMVLVSGVFEFLGGLGILIPKTRRFAALGLIALYICVFPANIYMAVEHVQIDPAHPMPDWVQVVRLPFQFLFIYLAWRISTLAPPKTM